MKRLFLSLAAIAALVSCVEEKGLEPQQPAPGQVTIKAVSADTKTLLDGTNVVWEDADQIKVVLDLATDELQDFTASEVDGVTATFKGQFAGDVASANQAYAIYPSTAVEINGADAAIYHTVDAVQYGTIESGDNLSYASLDVENLAAGNASTTFNNVYSLIKVTVPEGLTEVTIASESPLAGTAPFKMEEGVLKVNPLAWSELDKKMTIQLIPSAGEHLEAKTHDILIIPGTHALTITLNDGTTTYEKTVAAKEYATATYYNLNLTTVLSAPETEFVASPFGGGTIEIPFVTTVATPSYDVEITYDENGEGWLSNPQVKGLTDGIVTLTVSAEENTIADRTAIVTITETTSEKSIVVSVIQKYVDLNLLGEYVETYVQGTYYPTVTGTFEIKKTDNILEGVYLVDGILGGQKVYADYVDGTLTCYDDGNPRNLTVSEDYQISANGGLEIGLISISPYGGKYSATKKQGEPELTTEEEALVGRYDEAWKYEKSYGSDPVNVSADNGMTIEASDEAAFGRLKVTFLSQEGTFVCYANLDGSSLKVLSNGATHNTYGSAQQDITMTVSGETLSFSSLSVVKGSNWGTISDYTATKVVAAEGFDVEDLIGTYTQTFSAGGNSGRESTMKIQTTDDSSKGELKIVDMFKYNSSETQYSLTCYANLEDDGQTLTVLCNGVEFTSGDSFTENLQMIVSRDKDTDCIKISYSGSTSLKSWMPVGSLTAIKN